MGMNHKTNQQMQPKEKMDLVKLPALFSCQLPFGSDLKVRDIQLTDISGKLQFSPGVNK